MSSSKKNQHVVPHPKGWAVKGAGNEKATAVVKTQKEAADKAAETAKNQKSEVIIHRPNGQIRERRSQGNESPTPDKDHK